MSNTSVSLLIAEDERPQREELVRLLAELWPDARLVDACADGLEALEAIGRALPDVAFLDIHMPGMSGLELALSLSGRAHVVFVTAYDQYAIQAFEQGAVDYLLKPVQRERLARTVARLRARIATRPTDLDELIGRLRRELAAPAQGAALRWITASIGDTVKLISIDDVIAFRSQDKYTQVLTASDDALIRRSLRELTQELDPDAFWQVHRSVVVRVAAIDVVQRDELGRYTVSLKGRADRLPVASAFHARFRGM
jgi:DNA-binding LytR/AlgR family response regulator